jgi:hypothetical protein
MANGTTGIACVFANRLTSSTYARPIFECPGTFRSEVTPGSRATPPRQRGGRPGGDGRAHRRTGRWSARRHDRAGPRRCERTRQPRGTAWPSRPAAHAGARAGRGRPRPRSYGAQADERRPRRGGEAARGRGGQGGQTGAARQAERRRGRAGGPPSTPPAPPARPQGRGPRPRVGPWRRLQARQRQAPAPQTYDLRRLRLHQIIERIPHTNRYQVTPFGLQVAMFFSRTYTTADCYGPAFRRSPTRYQSTPRYAATSTDSTKRSPTTSPASTSPPET